MARTISRAVIQRMPRYYRYLSDLADQGTERISSKELSKLMHVTASQIRQDLNNFGEFGQQGYGYNVNYLREEIGRILRLDKTHKIVIIGAGNLGQALANYVRFEKRGFMIVALFDINPALKGTDVRGIPVYMMDDLERYIHANDVQIAVLTLPRSQAPAAAARVVNAGIEAIWNFAPVDLDVPENVLVENVHLSESMMRLTYRLGERKDG